LALLLLAVVAAAGALLGATGRGARACVELLLRLLRAALWIFLQIPEKGGFSVF